jgi:hypothetical protein
MQTAPARGVGTEGTKTVKRPSGNSSMMKARESPGRNEHRERPHQSHDRLHALNQQGQVDRQDDEHADQHVGEEVAREFHGRRFLACVANCRPDARTVPV